MKRAHTEFGNFDMVVRGLIAVPYSEMQQKLAEEKRVKNKRKKKRDTTPASSRASSVRKKQVV
jgi:inner membrane protein involved in colicin E2 resistance